VPASAPSGPAAGLPARGYAFVVVSLRYLVVGAWAAAVVLAIVFLPPLSATSSGGLSALIPPGSVLGDLGRSLLVPALVALFGRPGMWPGNRRVPPTPPDGTAARRPAPAGGRPTAVG
jgi:uncharacterized membrane protein YdfJ with MMPL/SSD domain